MKHTEDSVGYITQAPESGIWQMDDDGKVTYERFDYHRRAVETEQEAFYLRISGTGSYLYEGADLGILITRGRLMDDNFELNERAHQWIKGIQQYYHSIPIDGAPGEPDINLEAGAFKIL